MIRGISYIRGEKTVGVSQLARDRSEQWKPTIMPSNGIISSQQGRHWAL